MTRPETEFVIWFTARTGSTWLGSMLFLAGFPKPAEYFHPNKIIRRARYLGVNSWRNYVDSIKRKRTRSGVFGHEMTFFFWTALQKDGDALRYLDFSGPSVVLFREDIVLQAISIYLAVTTGKWHRYQGSERHSEPPQVAYDEGRIKAYIKYIDNLEYGLKSNPHQLTRHSKYLSYEQLLHCDSDTVIESFERHTGFKTGKRKRISSSHTRVRTNINLEFHERFLDRNRQWVSDVQEKRAWLFDSMVHQPLIDKRSDSHS